MGGDKTSAAVRARKLYKGQGFVTAYTQGAAARRMGRAKDTCPYSASRGGFAPAYRLAWIGGWDSEPDEPDEVVA